MHIVALAVSRVSVVGCYCVENISDNGITLEDWKFFPCDESVYHPIAFPVTFSEEDAVQVSVEAILLEMDIILFHMMGKRHVLDREYPKLFDLLESEKIVVANNVFTVGTTLGKFGKWVRENQSVYVNFNPALDLNSFAYQPFYDVGMPRQCYESVIRKVEELVGEEWT